MTVSYFMYSSSSANKTRRNILFMALVEDFKAPLACTYAE